jgi:hypothetical protein
MEGLVGVRAAVDGEETNLCPCGESTPDFPVIETVAWSLH